MIHQNTSTTDLNMLPLGRVLLLLSLFATSVLSVQRRVNGVDSFLAAFRDPEVDHIVLEESLRLRQYNGWDPLRAFPVDRSVVVEGAAGTDNHIVLDMGSLPTTNRVRETAVSAPQFTLTLRKQDPVLAFCY